MRLFRGEVLGLVLAACSVRSERAAESDTEAAEMLGEEAGDDAMCCLGAGASDVCADRQRLSECTRAGRYAFAANGCGYSILIRS